MTLQDLHKDFLDTANPHFNNDPDVMANIMDDPCLCGPDPYDSALDTPFNRVVIAARRYVIARDYDELNPQIADQLWQALHQT